MNLTWTGSSGRPGPVMHAWLGTPAELRGTEPVAPTPAPAPKPKSTNPARDRFLEDGSSAGGSVFNAAPEPEKAGGAKLAPVMTMDKVRLDAVQIVERKDADGWTSEEREVVVTVGVGGMVVFDANDPPGLMCYFPAPNIAGATEGTTNRGQTKTCEVTMELFSSETSTLKNLTSPGGRDKVKMLLCMEVPDKLTEAIMQTIECGVSEPPAAVGWFFSRVICTADKAPQPGNAEWQPDKACRSCNACQVAFQGNMKSLSTKLSKKGAHCARHPVVSLPALGVRLVH